MSTKKDYTERFKKMKSSIKENKHILDDDFPDDVEFSGDPDLLKKSDKEIDKEDKVKEKNHGK